MNKTLLHSLGVLALPVCCILLVAPADAGSTYSWDDGVSENSLGGGPPHPADLWWAQGFTVMPGAEMIVSIEIAFGTTVDGLDVQLLLYDDPTNDSDPTDAVLLTSVFTTTMFSGTDMFISIPITPTIVSGDFFVGALMSNTSTQFPLALDETTSAMRLWVAENTNGPGMIDPTDVMGTSTFGPALADSIGFAGNALLRATGVPIPAPGGIAVIGLALIAGCRRNRRSRSV